ncbi:LAFA_0D12508g1_1 [Lachancea sp. 'fantastica']|nr:LAFA_0D12508g1_1 [Lachancea sp. 'fantastica']
MVSTENEEVQLLEKADLRFVLAASEEALEQSLDIFFPAVLLKLSSEHASVRQVVFQVVKNVMGRISSLKSVKLPTAKLIAQAKEKSGNSLAVGQYSLLFASKGVERMEIEEKRVLVPDVISSFSFLPESLKPRMFNILCKLLLSWKGPPKNAAEEKSTLELLDVGSVEDKQYLLEKFTLFFFLNPLQADPHANVIPRGYSCPGLNVSEVEFFTYNAGVAFNKEHLLNYKEAIFRFVVSGFLPQDQLAEFLTVVSTDTSDLSNQAIGVLKRVHIPYEDERFIARLLSLYIGDKASGRPPVTSILQEKILSILTLSTLATKDFKSVSVVSSIGLNSSLFKLRSTSLNFIQHVAKYNHAALAAQDTSSDFSTNIASQIRNNLHNEGWPLYQLNSSVPNFAQSLEQRRKQYETLGVILKQDKTYIRDLSFVEFLLDSLRGDLSVFRVTIQDALASLSPLMKSLSIEMKRTLKKAAMKILNDNFDVYHGNPDGKEALMCCRNVMIKFINSTFPFEDSEARLLNVLGTWKDNRLDVKEESYKGLHPYWFRVAQSYDAQHSRSSPSKAHGNDEEVLFPNAEELVRAFVSKLKNSDSQSVDAVNQTLCEAVGFIFRSVVSRGTSKERRFALAQDEHWLVRVENSLQFDGDVKSLVKNEIAATSEEVLLSFLTIMIEELIDENSATHELQTNSNALHYGALVIFFADYATRSIIGQLRELVPSVHKALERHESFSEEDTVYIARLFGILFSVSPNDDEVSSLLKSTDLSVESKTIVSALYSASYSVPLSALHGTTLDHKQLSSYIEKLKEAARKSNLQAVAMIGFNPLLKYGLLRSLEESTRHSTLEELSTLFQKNLLKSRDSLLLWAFLSLYAADAQKLDRYFGALQNSHDVKELNFQFYTGEAISIIAGGWKSKVLSNESCLELKLVADLTSAFDDSSAEKILLKIIEFCKTTRPSLRKAACVWLLCFVQYLGDAAAVLTNAEDIHLCFVRFLAETDDIVQDSACRGLGLIYDLCSKEKQENMLRGLLKSFVDPKATTGIVPGTINSDTQLFEPGTLNTNEGSLTTYKDILNLASEAGDPSMVYKFMPLAKSSALWSSRKGMAFGLTSMFSKISLEDLLLSNRTSAEKFIPLLYRYRFDPFRNVADAMNGIWQTLIRSTAETVSTFYDLIMDEVLKGMGAKDWRVREASSYALVDLLNFGSDSSYCENLEAIWTMAFRVMDDVKESVRSAAIKLTKVLSSSLLRVAKKLANQTNSQETLGKIISLFLGSKGLNSDAEEVKSVALETLVRLIREAGDTLRSFAPSLTYEFLMMQSSLGPQEINYLTLNADKYNISATSVDLQIASAVRSSPIMMSVEQLINLCSGELLPIVVEKITLASKKCIGLPSKIGSTKAMDLLVASYPLDLKPFGAKLLKSCMLGLSDRNQVVREAYATTLGRVCKLCTPERISKYVGKLIKRFMDAENEFDRLVVGLAIESIHKYSASMFDSVASAFLPFIFVAKHSSGEVMKVFTRIWDEVTSSGAGTVRLHLAEIVTLASENLKSPYFDVRLMCAKSVCDVCTYALPGTSEKLIEQLCTVLLKASEGRSWQGKEVVVESLVSLATKFNATLLNKEELRTGIENRLLTEVARENQQYVRKVLLLILPFVKNLSSSVLFDKCLSVAQKLITDIDDSGVNIEGEDDAFDGNHKKQRLTSSITRKSQKENVQGEEFKIELLKKCAGAYGYSKTNDRSAELLGVVKSATIGLFHSQSIVNTWRSQIAVSEIGTIVAELAGGDPDGDTVQFLREIWFRSFEEASRDDALESVKIQCTKFGKTLMEMNASFRFVVESNLLEMLRSDPTPQVTAALHSAGIA